MVSYCFLKIFREKGEMVMKMAKLLKKNFIGGWSFV
jgi:hypothetical protein